MINAAANTAPSFSPSFHEKGYDNVFSAAFGNIDVYALRKSHTYTEKFHKDLRLLLAISGWALENGIMTSEATYKKLQEIASELQFVLDRHELCSLLPSAELECLKKEYHGLVEIICAIGIQRDGELFELLTGLDANDLPSGTD